jgi:hypothetical protein
MTLFRRQPANRSPISTTQDVAKRFNVAGTHRPPGARVRDDDPRMTADDEPPAADRPVDPSILSSLPGTRPQRRSPKRGATPTSSAAPPKPARAKPPPPAKPPPAAAQGYESAPHEGSANPPTGTELVASIAHAATELTDITFSLAKRLARTALDRLPRP